MAENMKESGKITIWRELESMFGTTDENMKVSIKMIRSTVSEFILGQMAVAMKDTGLKASNME